MDFSDTYLLQEVPKRNLRAVSRLITLSENQVPRARAVVSELYKTAGHAHVIGVTGPPGAGKSTLVDQLAKQWHDRGKKVAIVAIDPSSPFSGGAVLGDRIRMNSSVGLQHVFIRSMATRGALGGLSRATFNTVQILDAAHFDIILVETVGVGQAEIDIVRAADSCVVVLVPGMGDSVQAFKAGILEIADVYAINKSDRDGSDLLERDLLTLLSLDERGSANWRAPILKTVATNGTGVVELVNKLDEHHVWLASSPGGKERRAAIMEQMIIRLACDEVVGGTLAKSQVRLQALIQRCLKRELDPFSAAQELLHDT